MSFTVAVSGCRNVVLAAPKTESATSSCTAVRLFAPTTKARSSELAAKWGKRSTIVTATRMTARRAATEGGGTANCLKEEHSNQSLINETYGGRLVLT